MPRTLPLPWVVVAGFMFLGLSGGVIAAWINLSSAAANVRGEMDANERRMDRTQSNFEARIERLETGQSDLRERLGHIEGQSASRRPTLLENWYERATPTPD